MTPAEIRAHNFPSAGRGTYRSIDVDEFIGDIATAVEGINQEKMTAVKQEAIGSLSTGIFFDVKAEGGAPLVVGEMVNRKGDGSVALMICAADDPRETDPKEYNVTFRAPDRCIRALGGNGYKTVTDLGDGKSMRKTTVRSILRWPRTSVSS